MKKSARYLHVRIEPELKDRFAQACNDRNITASHAIRWLMLGFINDLVKLDDIARQSEAAKPSAINPEFLL